MNESRRKFLAMGGAAVALGRGYGTPLRRDLRLKVTNPDAPVVDPKIRGCEFPPNVVTVAGRRHVFMSGGLSFAYTVSPDFHLIREPQRMFESERLYAIGGFDYEITEGFRPFNTEYDAQKLYWKKTYCGTFNVDVLPPDSATLEQRVFSINHCENKNERFVRPFGTFYVHNSINRNDPSGPDTSSGPMPTGGYSDYQPGYFGIVSMSYAPVNADAKWGVELQKYDMGPILWPRSGFLTPDGKAKHPRYKNPHPHPSSLVAEDPKDGKRYVYVFANDSAEGEDESTMVVAARSPIEAHALPGSFLNFYHGDYTEPSLPKNMSEDIAILATRPGGNASAIHPDAVNRFFVARLRRSGLFLSVESYGGGEGQDSYFETALRLSEDLRTWTGRFVLPNSRVTSRQIESDGPPFGLFYPKFLSADGSSHYELDESGPFYIIATKPHALIHREVSIQLL